MCKQLPSLLAVLVGGTLVAAAAGLAQPDKPKSPAPPAKPTTPAQPDRPGAQPDKAKPAGMDDKMQEVQEAMQAGPEHAKLTKLAGTWDVVTTMEGAGMPPNKTNETSTITSELGGRFVHEKSKGEMMGRPVESFKMWGYNRGSKKYEGSWAWTMNTSVLHVDGESKDGGKTIDWNAWYQATPDHREEFKVHYIFTDDDHFTVKLDGGKMPDGSPGPVMTSVYTRK
jgi:hypothetical protein